jgi:hypothetical protein
VFGGSKVPAEVEKSGHIGDLSETQEEILQRLRTLVSEESLDPIGQFDDHDLLRFCRARKFIWDDVKTMFVNFIQWRKENGIDTIIEDFDFPEEDIVHTHYPFNFHGVDKEGKPVAYIQVGKVDVEKLF